MARTLKTFTLQFYSRRMPNCSLDSQNMRPEMLFCVAQCENNENDVIQGSFLLFVVGGAQFKAHIKQ